MLLGAAGRPVRGHGLPQSAPPEPVEQRELGYRSRRSSPAAAACRPGTWTDITSSSSVAPGMSRTTPPWLGLRLRCRPQTRITPSCTDHGTGVTGIQRVPIPDSTFTSDQLRSGERAPARLGLRSRRRPPRRTSGRGHHSTHPPAGSSSGHRSVTPKHPGRGRVLHLPARRRRRRLPLEPRLPQLRQVRPVRRRPPLLAPQTRAVATAGRRRPRRRDRRLPSPLLRAHRPRYRRPGEGPRRPRAPRRRPRPGLRKPQDYFHRVWSTAFRAADLADAAQNDGEYSDTCTTEDTDPEQDVA